MNMCIESGRTCLVALSCPDPTSPLSIAVESKLHTMYSVDEIMRISAGMAVLIYMVWFGIMLPIYGMIWYGRSLQMICRQV